MGVSGCGKSTVGKALANRLSCAFFDADDFHSEANKAKMSAGIALGDEDRAPWLEKLRQSILDWLASAQTTVLACSSLKESYRRLLKCDKRVVFVYLKLSFAEVEARLAARRNHFMNKALLGSQFATLEEPQGEWTIDGNMQPEEIAAQVEAMFRSLT